MNTNNKSKSNLNHSINDDKHSHLYDKVNIHVDENLICENNRLGGIDINSEIQKFLEDTNDKEFVFKTIK